MNPEIAAKSFFKLRSQNRSLNFFLPPKIRFITNLILAPNNSIITSKINSIINIASGHFSFLATIKYTMTGAKIIAR